MANASYKYKLPYGKTKKGLIAAVEDYLSSEKMETQLIKDDAGYKVLQARAKGGKWKQFVGMDKAIVVRFVNKSSKNKVRMEIGEAKWVDKGTVMAVSMFVLWPLAVTSGIGMYQQGKLPKKIKNAADQYIGIDDSPQKKEFLNEATVTKLGYAAQKLLR